jgi:CBS domain-containing protein
MFIQAWRRGESFMVAADKTSDYRADPEIAVAYFRKTVPFDQLDEGLLRSLSRHCKLDFYPKGTRILIARESEVDFLYLIQRGAVSTYIVDVQGTVSLQDLRGEGQFFGALGIIQRSRANVDVETVEDTFCILLPKRYFLELLDTQPHFANYFLKDFSDQLANTAYNELRRNKLKRRSSDDLLLFSNTVGDIVKRQAVAVDARVTIQAAAALMSERRIGSLLVHGRSGQIVGIITDRDLRFKVVAAGRDVNLPVAEIMSSPVQTVLSQALCFDVLLLMLSRGIRHLAVEQGDRIGAVVTASDIMSLQGNSPYYLFKEIVSQEQISGLYPLTQKTPGVIRGLLKEGGKASHITRMIAIINDHVLSRLLTLIEMELGPPPVAYCWLLLGSEGRREQIFKTDQDNGLVYVDPQSDAQRLQAEHYFAALAERAAHHLAHCGYPPCPGEIMAANPRWRQPYSVWRGYFASWVSRPDPQEVLNSTIFFDFRAGFGENRLADDLRNELVTLLRRQDTFLFRLARQTLTVRTPLSFFRNFIVEKNGEYKHRLDIKRKGTALYADVARILALRHGVKETNTLARFKVLADEGHLDRQLARAAEDSYELIMQLQLLHQLEQLEAGAVPDNHIDPADLTDMERRMLKESFRIIERLQTVLETIYPAP